MKQVGYLKTKRGYRRSRSIKQVSRGWYRILKWYKGAQRKLSIKKNDEIVLKVRSIASILDMSLEQEKRAKDMYIA